MISFREIAVDNSYVEQNRRDFANFFSDLNFRDFSRENVIEWLKYL